MNAFRRASSLLVVLLLGTASLAVAQQTPPPTTPPADQKPAPGRGRPGGPGGLGNPPAVTVNTIQDMLEGSALKSAQNALQLSDSQYLAFLPRMISLQRVRRDHQRERTRLINAIRQSTKPGVMVDEATIATDVKALDDLELKMSGDERAALAAVDTVLTPFQRARFRVFEDNNEREKVRLIGTVMADSARGGGGPAPTPAPSGKSGGGGHR
jgi:hypothetical protein